MQLSAASASELISHADEAMSSGSISVRSSNPTALLMPLASFEKLCSVAAPAYAALRTSDAQTVITVSPSIDGSFRRITIPTGDVYRGLACELRLDDNIRNELCDEDDDIYADDRGHHPAPAADHLPFLASLFPAGTIVPVVMGEETLEFCHELAAALAEVMFNNRVVLIATVGVPEGEPAALTAFHDALNQGDVERLQHLQVSGDIRLTGFGALLTVLRASAERRAKTVEVLSNGDQAVCAIVSRSS